MSNVGPHLDNGYGRPFGSFAVAWRIAAGFALALVVLGVVGSIAFVSLRRYAETSAWVEHTYRVIARGAELVSGLSEAEAAHLGFLLTGDESLLGRYSAARDGAASALEEVRRLTADNAAQQERLARIAPRFDELAAFWDDALARRREAKGSPAMPQERGRRLRSEILRAARELEEEERRLLDGRVAEAERWGANARRAIAVGIPAGAFLLALVGFVIARSITGPVRTAVGRLAATSSEIFAAASQQASGGEQQAAAVAETATTVEQMAQTARQVSEKAQGVMEAAGRTVAIADEGRKAVDAAVESMDTLQECSASISSSISALAEQAERIGEIIATVSDVADRTNLLALNAAIEAARAGEHGKGFSVVAAEIRSLAEQSKEATERVRRILTEIQDATGGAVDAAEEGTRAGAEAVAVVRRAGETIATLADAIAQANRAAMQIAASARQQSSGMAQVTEAIRNIEQVTRQNLASTRQMEQAARDLTLLGSSLGELLVGRPAGSSATV